MLSSMSVWGKLGGAAAGFAVGGPVGALLGGVAGHLIFDSVGSDGRNVLTKASEGVGFTIAMIALSAKMAKADGAVTQDEVDTFGDIFDVPPDEVPNVRRIFDLAQRDVAGFREYAHQIANMYRGDPARLEDILDALFEIAKADGVLHAGELQFLQQVSEIFGFTQAEFRRIRATHFGSEAGDPYIVLGVPYEAEDEDIKRAYRKLVRENHPDALIARGVPEEFVKLANAKLAAINGAYERISRERGIA
jgi:DnaJ like chaperone protein